MAASLLGLFLVTLGVVVLLHLILVRFDLLGLAVLATVSPLSFAVIHDVVITYEEMKKDGR